MTRMRSARPVGVLSALCLTLALASAVCAEVLTGLRPAEPQPTALSPGLAVDYWYGMVNHINKLRTKKFEPGPVLMNLDYHWGAGNVLTSKAREGVGAIITGFIRFDQAGRYGFAVTSNDGVRVEIGGRLLHEDPGVHGDTTSDRLDVQIDRAGWYPLRIVYFQKKGTAALVLAWIGPGEKSPLGPEPRMPLRQPRSLPSISVKVGRGPAGRACASRREWRTCGPNADRGRNVAGCRQRWVISSGEFRITAS